MQNNSIKKDKKMVSLGSSTYFATTTTCFFPFRKFDPAYPKVSVKKKFSCYCPFKSIFYLLESTFYFYVTEINLEKKTYCIGTFFKRSV